MNFDFTEEQVEMLEPISKLAVAEFAPRAFDSLPSTPEENIKQLAHHGLLALSLPEEYGGAGRPAIDAVLAVEKLAEICPRTAWYFLNVNLGPGYVLTKLARPEICERYVTPSASGDLKIRLAITEPDAGSDVGAMQNNCRGARECSRSQWFQDI